MAGLASLIAARGLADTDAPPAAVSAATSLLSWPMSFGFISLTAFPAVGLVGLGGREPVAEGDGEGVDRGLRAP